MARQVSDDRATAAVPSASPPHAVSRTPGPLTDPLPLVALAAAVAVGAGLGGLAALGLQPAASPATSMEPALASLLHAMVGVKALILMAATTLVLLRLRRPVGPAALWGYCGGLGVSIAAVVWLWGLSGLLVGSALFYGGLITTYLTASRDPLLGQALIRGSAQQRRVRGPSAADGS